MGGRRPPRTAPTLGEAGSRLARLPVARADFAAPGAGLHSAALDHVLEALEVALDAPAVHAERAADLLENAVGLVLHLHGHAGLVVGEAVEGDDPGVAVALNGLPRHALVGALLGDPGRPGVLLAAGVGHPVQQRVVDLLDDLHAVHEPRELLELRPLVVRRAHGNLNVDCFGDGGHSTSSVSRP